MNTITPALLQSIANMALLCMKYSSSEFEINLSLYPTKSELNIYVYQGGYIHAWRNPEQRIQKTRIDLSRQSTAIKQMHDAFCEIEKQAKGAVHASS